MNILNCKQFSMKKSAQENIGKLLENQKSKKFS